jgi:hypothetical protein
LDGLEEHYFVLILLSAGPTDNKDFIHVL